MELHAITYDQVIVIDGEGLPVSFEMPNGEWAVHWDGRINRGEVEYTDSRLNETITSLERYQHLIDAFVDTKTRIDAERMAAIEEAETIQKATDSAATDA